MPEAFYREIQELNQMKTMVELTPSLKNYLSDHVRTPLESLLISARILDSETNPENRKNLIHRIVVAANRISNNLEDCGI